MYNYNLILTYKNKDDINIYQKEFLQCFNLDEYNYEIIKKKMNNLYSKVNDIFSEAIEIIKKNNNFTFKLDNRDYFQLLFSWENLEKTHIILNQYFNKKKFKKI